MIQKNADDASKYDVTTYFGTVKVDTQTVVKAADLVANDYVTFKAADLAVTAGTPLTGGTNGTVDGTAHQAYLDKIESYTYNTMGVVVTDDVTKKLYVAFNKRLRDELGIKFQLVVYNLAADYMGVISVKNKVTDAGWSEAALVYWVTGAESGCAVNKSCQNKKYDGNFTVDTNYTQNELKAAIKAGEFTFHKVNSVVRVLEDINSMVTTSDTCGDVFKDNQTIRVIDQLGNDDAVLFNTKYLGVVPNNASGRTSLWSDLVKIRQQLQELGAIEGFTDSDVTVQQEVQSANDMLNTLNTTQARISQTAQGMDILPDAAVQDMNTMQQRLSAIQQRIQQIENNPVNVGADNANAELEQLRMQLNQAIQEQNSLNQAMQNMDVSAANDAYLRLSQTVGSTERYIRDNVDEQGRFNQEVSAGTQQANELTNTQLLMIPLNQGVQGFKASGSTQSRTLGKCCFKSCLSFAVTVILK